MIREDDEAHGQERLCRENDTSYAYRTEVIHYNETGSVIEREYTNPANESGQHQPVGLLLLSRNQ